MAHWRTGLAALAIAALTATTAAAQTGTQPRDPNMPDPKNVPPEKVAPPLDPSSTGSTGETLSERLRRTEGVLKPAPSGDAMLVPAPVPNPNTTPVIRPPGTSPADPIQPK